MRIAIIGSGIAGHGAAYQLTKAYGPAAVTVFEKENRPGGHSATVDIVYDGIPISVDTGFIVYNELNYPLMTALFAELGVETQLSDMGFALSLDDGAFEWSGQDKDVLASMFAQPSNALRPAFWRMLADMMRFNARAVKDLETGALTGLTLGAYLARGGYGAFFRDNYILPMGAAIWSMPSSAVLDFPAQSFVAFFNNHRLLHLSRPRWRTVTGGSRNYVRALIGRSGHQTVYGDPVLEVQREGDGVRIVLESGRIETFDAVVMATHSDTASELIAAHWPEEAAIVADIRYAEADVYLHRDPAFMPRRKRAWAAWNVLRQPARDAAPVTVTYWMNRLQGIDPARPLFVTLNPPAPPAEGTVFGHYRYAHPQYDQAAITAQGRMAGLQGRGRLYFAGAWMGYGFHEDGLRAGFDAAARLIADRAGHRVAADQAVA
ncbi:MAG: FAD-dependent oxidoreductase [Beijerinckiaceae bacterium]|nr:FAD-dependent oxidoreductase [Beijerinckiaceae bacterium]